MMKKYLLNLYWLLIFFLLTGCQSTELIRISDAYFFSDKSFNKIQYLSSIIVNDTFIGSPVRLTQLDTLLYVVDSSLDSLVHIFDIKNNAYKGLSIRKGNGPNELLSIGHIIPSIDHNTVWANDIMTQRWVQYDKQLNTIINRIQFSKVISDDMYVNEPQWISDDTFVCLSFNSHKERFYLINNDLTNIKPVFNPQFTFDENVPPFILNDIFSSLLHVRPDKKKVVLADRYLDCIEIYNVDGSLTKLLKGPENIFNFKYDKSRSLGNGVVVKSPESRRAYIGLRSDNDRIYALYSGKMRMDKSNYSTSNIIYTFDWDGNLLKKYILDCQINSFDVDATTQTIYAIQEPEKSIICFQF
ncbi:MAG: TolB-like 6-bladed beta-propeller domain-containing protein [Tannerella sp.]|jgi:hypothetical protein|nr:TolB-like 6-bladed beta-propeller domain-containing protein [Tannerella sp.]